MATPVITPLDSPFIQVEGLFNFRTVGEYIIQNSPNRRIKPNLLFRSGELSRITAQGAVVLHSLNINRIVDLRSENEIGTYKSQSPHLSGIQIDHIPVHKEMNFEHDFLTENLKQFEKDERNKFLAEYKESLDNLSNSLEATIRHLINDPEHPPLVHCTAGKDRTGVLVAVILKVLGVSDEQIAEEYALTTIGMQPVYDLFSERLFKIEAVRNNLIGTQNMGSSRAENMLAVLKMFKDDYGTVEEYINKTTTLTSEEVHALCNKVIEKLN